MLAVIGVGMASLLIRARVAEVTPLRQDGRDRRARQGQNGADKANIEKLKAETAQHEAELQRDAAETQQRVAQAAANEAKARQLVAESEDLRSKDGQLTLRRSSASNPLNGFPIVDNQHAIGAALDLQARERARFEAPGFG